MTGPQFPRPIHGWNRIGDLVLTDVVYPGDYTQVSCGAAVCKPLIYYSLPLRSWKFQQPIFSTKRIHNKDKNAVWNGKEKLTECDKLGEVE